MFSLHLPAQSSRSRVEPVQSTKAHWKGKMVHQPYGCSLLESIALSNIFSTFSPSQRDLGSIVLGAKLKQPSGSNVVLGRSEGIQCGRLCNWHAPLERLVWDRGKTVMMGIVFHRKLFESLSVALSPLTRHQYSGTPLLRLPNVRLPLFRTLFSQICCWKPPPIWRPAWGKTRFLPECWWYQQCYKHNILLMSFNFLFDF